jgi:hypothetical protein
MSTVAWMVEEWKTYKGLSNNKLDFFRNLLRSPISSLRCSTPLQGAFAFAHANRFTGGKHASRNPGYAYSYACASRLNLGPLATVSKEVYCPSWLAVTGSAAAAPIAVNGAAARLAPCIASGHDRQNG